MLAVLAVLAGLILGAGAFTLLAYRRGWQWTGFTAVASDEPEERSGKTLWDWMQLLIVPLALAAAAFLACDFF